MENWPDFKSPPVVVALFQLKYNSKDIKLSDFLKFDLTIKQKFPTRRDNIEVGIALSGSTIPLGKSQISGTSDAKVESYVYFSTDQKIKLEVSENTITYIDECPYQGWQNFKNSAIKTLVLLSEVLNKVEIIRTSIRFINRFSFDNFDNPQEYFNTFISRSDTKDLPFPLRQYGFRLLMDIPNTDIYAIVNQSVENIRTQSYIYTFDIDVLDKQHLLFDKSTLEINLEVLRNVKNKIFFNNLTQKAIDLCN